MSSRDSSLKALENEFSEFLIKRIVKAGGSIQLQHITGHLAQVRDEVRNAIVSTKSDLEKFLRKHDNLFVIENNAVSLVKSSAFSTSGYDSDSNSTKSLSNLPPKIKNGKGVIVKLFSGYGFIKSKEPIKTEVFFRSLCFGDRGIDLTSFLHVGAIVFFHAKRELSQTNCKYNATKVWRIDNGDDESNVIVQKSRKNRETGLYDPLNLESSGVIQNIFSNLGFISVKGDEKNTVFFHKNRVVNYDNIVDLTKVFSKGDRVEFTAHRSSKPDAKARWEAIKVWKVSGKIQENVSQSDNKPISGLRTKAPEMIKDQLGRIYPRSNGAVIKFGNNELADGDAALYYVCGTQVTEIGWEFTEGDNVYFDAVKIKSAPGWKAVLVWTDKKPNVVLPTCLGDYSEFIEEDDKSEICSSIYTSKSSLCMSESSSSSLKSERFSSKSKDSKKENTRKLSDYSVCKEVKNTNKLSKNHITSFSRDSLNSLPVSENYCFGDEKANDLNKKLSKNCTASSRDSLNSLPVSDRYCFTGKKVKDTNKKLSKNYNAASKDSLSSLTSSDRYYNLKSSEKIFKSSSNKVDDQLREMVSNWGDSPSFVDEAYESMEPSKSFKSDNFLKSDREIKHFTEDEIENSSEYASAEEEKIDKNSEVGNDKSLSQNISSKCTASIKRYCDIKGNIIRIFSRLAEVKSDILQNPVSFSLNDFYSDKKTIEELGLDDLKDILKVGDSINFNFFEIIDDSGETWQKITLAWKGFKPRYSGEITPEDFIKQHDLSVTVSSKISDDDIADKVIQRKFLTSFVDENPDDNIDNSSKTESCSDSEDEDDEESLTLNPKLTELSVDADSLLDTVYKILMRDVFPKNSTVKCFLI